MKKKIIILFVMVMIAIPIRTSAQFDRILDMITPSSDALFLSGFITLCETVGLDGNQIMTSLLGNFDEYTGSIRTAVTKITELSKLYSTSKNVLMMTEYTAKIYKEYHSGVKVVLSNYLIFTEDEVKNFISMLDYAAFRTTALDNSKSRTLDRIAGGAYFDFIKLANTQNDGGQITIKTIIDEQRISSNETISSYKDVKAINNYIQSSIFKRQKELGIIDMNKVIKSVKDDWKRGTYYNPRFSFKNI